MVCIRRIAVEFLKLLWNDKTLFVIAPIDILIFIHHIKCNVTDVDGFPLQNLITECNSLGYSFPEAERCVSQMF